MTFVPSPSLGVPLDEFSLFVDPFPLLSSVPDGLDAPVSADSTVDGFCVPEAASVTCEG
ncbi:hypothetical protein RV02_GL003698 [Enterococcus gilvus]|nr:hypothetical protein RV02_GL003698 [Enterococcus gilvus]